MGLFSKLFGKKASVSDRSRDFTVDIREDGFVINGRRFDVPIHIAALNEVLGEPRKTVFKTKKEDREIYEKLHPGEILVERTNYTWDDLGMMCYTNNGKVVNTFGICLNKASYDVDSNPKCLFGGKLLINDGHWLDAVKSGQDCDVLKQLFVGNYMLTAEYTDFDADDEARDESGFTGIEIQLNDGTDLSELSDNYDEEDER